MGFLDWVLRRGRRQRKEPAQVRAEAREAQREQPFETTSADDIEDSAAVARDTEPLDFREPRPPGVG